MYYVSKYQGYQNFKPCYMLTIKYISKSKKTLKLLLNIGIILFSNKIQLLRKLFVNYFAKNLREATEFDFLYITSSFKKYGKYILVSSQSNCSHFYLVIVNAFVLHTYRNRRHTDI